MRKRLALAVAAVLVVTACADPDSGSGDTGPRAALPAVAPVPSVVSLVPKDVAARRTLRIATSAPYAPMEFFENDNETLTGFDIDLGNAVGAAMGLRTQWSNLSLDSAIPGLQAGRYDAAMSGLSTTAARLGSVDMVSYYLSGGGFLVRRGSGVRAGSFASLCGYRVAVKKGVSQADALATASEGCVKAGKPPISVLQLPDQNVVVLTLQSRRADVVAADKPQVEHAESASDGALCVSSTYQTTHSIAGIAVQKGHQELLRALRAAVNALVSSGAYAAIARRWGTGTPERQTTSAAFTALLRQWGITAQGTVGDSRIFTEPRQISSADHYFYQPIREGCG